MDQVLFWIPVPGMEQGIPVFGFGVMLFLAFAVGSWLAGTRAERIGLPSSTMKDVAIWIFVAGLIGGRIVYMVQYGKSISEVFRIWEGGIVFYGGAIGGAAGCMLAYQHLVKKFNINLWQVADVTAPSVAVGLCLGRIGCLLNGCCFGHVASPEALALEFPSMTSPARDRLVTQTGDQTIAGFTLDSSSDGRVVGAVESGSPAEAAGLKQGDVLVDVNGRKIENYGDLMQLFFHDWPRGRDKLALTVERQNETVKLDTFVPRTIGLFPTQIYESVSMILLFFVLISWYPLRTWDGQVFVVLMIGYAIHRYLNEMLRDDTPVYYGFTLSQWISIGIFATAVVLTAVLRRRGRQTAAA